MPTLVPIQCDDPPASDPITRRAFKAGRAAQLGLLILLPWVSLFVLPLSAEERPGSIRPGHSYYSDEYVERGLVRDILTERNYEEVYQRYTYYEAVYDEAGRVATFREYRRGETIRLERYRYGPNGTLLDRIVEIPGNPADATRPSPAHD